MQVSTNNLTERDLLEALSISVLSHADGSGNFGDSDVGWDLARRSSPTHLNPTNRALRRTSPAYWSLCKRWRQSRTSLNIRIKFRLIGTDESDSGKFFDLKCNSCFMSSIAAIQNKLISFSIKFIIFTPRFSISNNIVCLVVQ